MRALLGLLYVIFQITISSCTSTSCEDETGHKNCVLLPEDDQCGPLGVGLRIVGGDNVILGQYPWVAIIFDGEDKFGCAATIVSERYLVSAAHCFSPDTEPQKLTTRVGEYDLNSAVDCSEDECLPPPQNIPVQEFRIHEEYSKGTSENDVSVIRLVRPIEFGKYVRPICLPFSKRFAEDDFVNSTLVVAGWGAINVFGTNPHLSIEYPTVLQAVKLQVVPLEVCQGRFPRPVTEKQLCAGNGTGRDACVYDSGGPLMGRFREGNLWDKYFLIGVVSYGPIMCGSSAAVYTNVARYVLWILDNMIP